MKRINFLSVLILISFVLWFCQDLVIGGKVPFYRDLTNYFYPLRYSLYESYRAGELPLWDRHFAQGFPNFAGFQSGAFYPPHFLFLFLSFFSSVQVLFVLHFSVAAVGTYCLLRHWRYEPYLSIIGSMLFTFGGAIVSLTNLLNHFQSAVWLPWLLLSWEQLLVKPKWKNFIVFTFTAALQVLAGSPELFAMSIGLVLIDAVRISSMHRDISCFRILTLITGANILMATIIMAQLLPTAELVIGSRRGLSIPPSEASMWSLSPMSLLNMFFLDKEIDLSLPGGMRLFFLRDPSLLVSSYVGVISLVGMTLWAIYASRREKIFLAVLFLGSLAMALGGNALIYPFLLQNISFMAAFRFPEKFFFVTYALLIFMVMRGLRGFLHEERKTQKGLIAIGCVCMTSISVYFILRFHSAIVSDFIAANSSIVVGSDTHARATIAVLTNLQRQAILLLGLFFLLLLVKLHKIRPVLFSTLLVSVVYVDLAWAHRDLLFTLSPDRLFDSAPILEPAEVNGTRFFYYPAPHDLHPAFFSVLGRPTFEQAVALSFENHMPNVGVFHGVDYFQEIDALNRREYSDFLTVANRLDFELQIKLLSTLNIKYIVSFRQLPEKGIRLVGYFPKYFSWLYRVETVVPRAYIVDKVSVENNSTDTLRKLSSAEFKPLKEVILEHAVPIRSTGSLKAETNIEKYENNSVRIQTESAREGILVLADSYYPGWKAFVDGKETKIFRANHFFRAVSIPKGNHRIEFKYEPWSFKVGRAISIFSLASIGLISVILYVRQRQPIAPTLRSWVRILQHQ